MKKLRNVLRVLLSVVLLVTMLPAVPATGKVETAKAAAAATSAEGKKIIVYFPNWGIYNSAHKSMTVGMIPWNKVTVINHAFFEVNSSFKLASTDDYADFDMMMAHSEGWDTNQLRGHMGEYKYYKTLNPNVKILISVGGWTRGQNFHAMSASSSTRAIFIQSVVDFLKKYPFIDGIDIDWEYPGINRAADPNDEYDRGCPGGPEDKKNFTYLLQELRQAYNNNGLSGKILTIAASAGYDKLELQEPDVYAQYLDWINVMTYDFHGAWENTTNHNSPLYANPADPSDTSPVDIKNTYNTDYAMRTLQQVYHIPAEKLNVGSPYYSRGWKGVTGGVNGMYANATGATTGTWDNPHSPGGQYPYFTLKTMENSGGYIKYRDDTYAKTPWLYNASQGIVLSYEDSTSLSARCDYINSNGYGGLIVWEISGDTSDYELTTLAYNKLIGSAPEIVAAPVFAPAAGTYTSAQTVTITCATSGAQIRYTTDGSEPTSSSGLYSSALTISKTTTLKAKAFKSGMTNSATTTAVYTIADSQTVADPVFAPAAGTYTGAQTVSINCATSGAEIRYTTNGSEPTSSSSLYSSALTISSNTTVKAKAFKSGMNASSTVTAVYTISNTTETVASPVFSPAGGTYTSAQTVTITCATSGAEIRYTTDGTEPASGSSLYSSALTVSSTTTIKAKAFKSGMNASATVTQTYTINGSSDVTAWAAWTAYKAGDLVSYGGQIYECRQPHTSLPGWEPANVPALWSLYSGTVVQTVAAPVFAPAAGTYTVAQTVSISCATAGAEIRYTTDGSEPTSGSSLYSSAIMVSTTTNLKAKAFKSGMNNSSTVTAAYTISDAPVQTVASPAFSPAGGTYKSDQTVTITCATSGAEIRYTTNGSEPTSGSSLYSSALTVSSTTTVKAKAFKSGMNASATVTQTYTIDKSTGDVTAWAAYTAYKAGDLVSYDGKVYECRQPHTSLPGWEPSNVPALWSVYDGPVVQTVATPVLSPAGGTYTASQSVTITCATAGSTIRYTLDGSEPTSSSTAYTGAISIASTATVKAKAFLSGMNDSQTASATYTINKSDTVTSPLFSPAAGTYYGSVNVTLSCATGNATIRYTTDGTNPTAASAVYTGAIAVTATTTIKAYAAASGLKDSAVVTAVYTITNDSGLPAHILTGYWQNFDNGATCLKISDVPATYNIIAVAFAMATTTPGEVTFALDSTLASRLGGYTKQQFISDIAAAKAKGQKVIISVGGETGTVSVSSDTAATNFANSVYALMTEYGFDGVDIDLENGINATYMTSALRKLSAKAGQGLIITMAPQTLDMQNVGSGYFQTALNIKDILTVVNTQYYNSGTMLGQDGKVYAQGNVDFITALAAIQLENGLRPDQVGLGLPASSRAAGGGYVAPSVVNSALECLTQGTGGGSYKPPHTYPTLRGAMTWSINWDASNNYNFANTVSAKLKTLP